MCAEELPKVRIGDRRYYQDDRLEEFRAVDNPHDRISFGDLRRLYSKISGCRLNADGWPDTGLTFLTSVAGHP